MFLPVHLHPLSFWEEEASPAHSDLLSNGATLDSAVDTESPGPSLS